MSKETQSLINKYNRSVDSIKSQELAIDKVCSKLELIKNGEIIPTSLKELDKQLKENEKELEKISIKIQEIKDKGQQRGALYNSEKKEILELEKSSDVLKQIISEVKEEMQSSMGNAPEVKHLEEQIGLMESKLIQTKEEANQTGEALKEAFDKEKQLLNIGSSVEDVSKKIDKFKNKISRLISTAMVFSLIRSGLTSLRNGLIGLLKQNDAFSNSLNQIKANLMRAFAPIYNACLPAINSLMNAIAKLTGTIAKFVSSLFGISLKNANDQAKKLSSSLKKVSSNGKKASNSLASFDKLEVLTDSSNDGSGGNEIDYSGEIQYSQKLLDFLNRVKELVIENKDLIGSLFAGLLTGLALFKLGLDGITSLGIGIMVAGIVYAVKSLIEYLKDPSWENFGKIIQGIGIFVIGLGVAFLGLPAIITGVVILILGTIIKYWDKIKAFLQSGIDWLTGKSDWVHNKFGDTIGNIYDFFVRTLQRGLDFIDNIFITIKGIFDGFIQFIKGVFTGNWKQAWEGVKQIFTSVWNGIKKTFNLFISSITDKVKTIGSTVGNVLAGAFKAVVNGVLNSIENILNTPIKTINGLIKTINTVPGVNISKLDTFKLPRLAQGTVIPPRHEFAAILGDQKHGTNIEAPLDTIKQANKEVLEEFFTKFNGLSNDDREIVLKNLTIVAQFGTSSFQKLVIDAVRLTEKEIGKQLFAS